MDGMGWQDLKSLRQLLVRDGGLPLRDVFEECAHPCMRRHPIVLSPKLGHVGHGHLLAPTRRMGVNRNADQLLRGTEGSNLAPSSGESGANPTSSTLIGERDR